MHLSLCRSHFLFDDSYFLSSTKVDLTHRKLKCPVLYMSNEEASPLTTAEGGLFH